MPDSTAIVAKLSLSVILLGTLAGCRSGQFYDPNDPTYAAVTSPQQIQIAVAGIYDNLSFRKEKKQISEAKLRAELVARTREFTKAMNLNDVAPQDAWRVGDVLRTAESWKDAEAQYEVAVKTAVNEDRRVNDSLRWAQCLAMTGRVDEAIKAARSTFNAVPRGKAPILPAVLLEVVPAAEGKGRDAQLAALLVDAIEQHMLVEVDPRTEGGRSFIGARKHHVRNGLLLAEKLYRRAGKPAEADKILQYGASRLRAIP